jgi:hypothetical protein
MVRVRNSSSEVRRQALIPLLLVLALQTLGSPLTAHGADKADSTEVTLGISGSGARGISGSGARGISGSGARGISGSGARGISGSGARGISGSGARGISGSGARGISGSGARGISGSGARGISGSGARGISGSGARGISGSGARGISGSGARGISGSGARGISGSGARGIGGNGGADHFATDTSAVPFTMEIFGPVTAGLDGPELVGLPLDISPEAVNNMASGVILFDEFGAGKVDTVKATNTRFIPGVSSVFVSGRVVAIDTAIQYAWIGPIAVDLSSIGAGEILVGTELALSGYMMTASDGLVASTVVVLSDRNGEDDGTQ